MGSLHCLAIIIAFIGAFASGDDIPTASISAHVLDIALGRPAAGVQIKTFYNVNGTYSQIGSEKTNSNGRVNWVSPGFDLKTGNYKIVYYTQLYYNTLKIDTFYPFVEVHFQVKDNTQHYHVPLTLSPFGYSTYRGS